MAVLKLTQVISYLKQQIVILALFFLHWNRVTWCCSRWGIFYQIFLKVFEEKSKNITKSMFQGNCHAICLSFQSTWYAGIDGSPGHTSPFVPLPYTHFGIFQKFSPKLRISLVDLPYLIWEKKIVYNPPFVMNGGLWISTSVCTSASINFIIAKLHFLGEWFTKIK